MTPRKVLQSVGFSRPKAEEITRRALAGDHIARLVLAVARRRLDEPEPVDRLIH